MTLTGDHLVRAGKQFGSVAHLCDEFAKFEWLSRYNGPTLDSIRRNAHMA
jgi:hypothetical protein